MLDLIRRYRELLAVAALLVLPLLLFLSESRAAGERNVFERGLVTVFSPAQRAVVWTVNGAQDLWFDYVDLVHVRQHNQRLRREVLRLEGEATAQQELRQENRRLRGLLDFRRTMGTRSVAAPIIAVGGDPALVRTVRVGQGTSAGIGPGQAVVTPAGVVGSVVSAGPGWADVMLLADPNSAIAVQVSRSRARATVRGTGDLGQARLANALRTDDIAEGDLLVTAGTGGIFPKGLPVGRVTKVTRKKYGMFQAALVVPAVDLSKVEEVLVLTGPHRSAAARAPLPGGQAAKVAQTHRGALP